MITQDEFAFAVNIAISVACTSIICWPLIRNWFADRTAKQEERERVEGDIFAEQKGFEDGIAFASGNWSRFGKHYQTYGQFYNGEGNYVSQWYYEHGFAAALQRCSRTTEATAEWTQFSSNN